MQDAAAAREGGRRRAALGEGRRAQPHGVSFKARGMSAAVTRARGARRARARRADRGQRGRGARGVRRGRGHPGARVRARDDAASRFSTRSARSAPSCISLQGHIGDAGKRRAPSPPRADTSTSPRCASRIASRGRRRWGSSSPSSSTGRCPTHIIYPTGGGTGLIGMWKVFAEMRDGGWLEATIAVPAHGRRAGGRLRADRARVRGGGRSREPWENPTTHASGLRVPGPLGDRLILRALRESGGDAAARRPKRRSARERWDCPARAGSTAAPEGGCALAVCRALVRAGRIVGDGARRALQHR